MELETYWKTYVGEQTPSEFLAHWHDCSLNDYVTAYVDQLPHLYGVVLRGTWKDTFTAEGQPKRSDVTAGLLGYLEVHHEEWAESPIGQVEVARFMGDRQPYPHVEREPEPEPAPEPEPVPEPDSVHEEPVASEDTAHAELDAAEEQAAEPDTPEETPDTEVPEEAAAPENDDPREEDTGETPLVDAEAPEEVSEEPR